MYCKTLKCSALRDFLDTGDFSYAQKKQNLWHSQFSELFAAL